MRNFILFTILLVSGFMSAQTFDFSCEDESASASASYEALASGYEITIEISNINHFGEGLDINVNANGAYLTDFTGKFINTNTFTFTVNPLETTTYSIEITGGDPESVFATAEVPVPSSGKGGPSAGKGLPGDAEEGSMTIETTSIAFDVTQTGLTAEEFEDIAVLSVSSVGSPSFESESDFFGLSLSDDIKTWTNIGNGGITFRPYNQITLGENVYAFDPIVKGEMNEVVLREQSSENSGEGTSSPLSSDDVTATTITHDCEGVYTVTSDQTVLESFLFSSYSGDDSYNDIFIQAYKDAFLAFDETTVSVADPAALAIFETLQGTCDIFMPETSEQVEGPDYLSVDGYTLTLEVSEETIIDGRTGIFITPILTRDDESLVDGNGDPYENLFSSNDLVELYFSNWKFFWTVNLDSEADLVTNFPYITSSGSISAPFTNSTPLTIVSNGTDLSFANGIYALSVTNKSHSDEGELNSGSITINN